MHIWLLTFSILNFWLITRRMLEICTYLLIYIHVCMYVKHFKVHSLEKMYFISY